MNIELYNQIYAWLNAHKDSIVSDIERLVKIPSVSTYDEPPHPFGKACADVLNEALKLGADHRFIARNIDKHCGSLTLNDEPPFIGFWGHLDVVPAGDGWENDPFEVTRRDGYIIGRGVSDNKGPTVGIMYVIKCLRDLDVPLRHNLKLFLGIDEEHGMADAIYYAEHYESPALTIIADSGFPVCYGEKGVLQVNVTSDAKLHDIVSLNCGVASNVVPAKANAVILATDRARQAVASMPEHIDAALETTDAGDVISLTAHGTAAHSARPEQGVNAIYLLTKALTDTKAISEHDALILRYANEINSTTDGAAVGIRMNDELSGELTCAGTMASIVDGRFNLHLNIRYCVSAKADDLMKSIESAAVGAGYCAVMEHDSAPAYYPRESPIIDMLTNVYNTITGKDEKPFVMGGGTYARKLPRAIGFGPGGIERDDPAWKKAGHGAAHGPDEMVHVDDLIQSLAIIAMGVIEADALLAGDGD